MIRITLTEYNRLKRDNTALVEALEQIARQYQNVRDAEGYRTPSFRIEKAKRTLKAAQKGGE